MRNHIVFKFIAVLLCAASLLGIAGSAVGVFVLTEMDLYTKTVDQVKEARIQEGGQAFAHEAALRYASQTLGNCPEAFVESYYDTPWFYEIYEPDKYSYSLLDAEGNEVYSYGDPLTNAATYTFPASGQYLHVVSQETVSEHAAKAQAETASFSTNLVIGQNAEVMDALPPEGKRISYAAFYDPLGTVIYETFNAETGVGYLYYGQNGNVTFSAFESEYQQTLLDTTIAGVVFYDLLENVVYKATSLEGVGTASFNTMDQLIFTAGDFEPLAEPEPAADTPAGGISSEIVPVFYVAFHDVADNLVYETYGEESVGFLSVNQDGFAVYRSFGYVQQPIAETVSITDVSFCGRNENVIYEASSSDGVGTISYTEHGQLIFTSTDPAPEFKVTEATEAPPEETAEETTEEENSEKEESEEETEPTEEADSEEKENSSASDIPTVPAQTKAPAATEPLLINGKPLDEFQIETGSYYDSQLQEQVIVSYVYTPMPEYTVELHLAPNALGDEYVYDLLRIVQYFSSYLLPAMGICLLAFAVCVVYLCCAAGRKPKSEEVRAGGLNRMPLDLYFALAFSGIALMVGLGVVAVEELFQQNILVCCVFVALAAFAVCMIFVGFCFAFIAQIKTPGGYWWKNSLCGRCIAIFVRFALWLDNFLTTKCFPALGRLIKALWRITCKAVVGLYRLWGKFASWLMGVIRSMFAVLGSKIHRFFSLLPITWQWLLTGCIMIFVLALTTNSYNGFVVLVGLVLTLGIILYGAHSFGTLAESAKRMSKGDLDTKVDGRLMIGCFEEFASDLNDLADVAVVAAQKQLKSERMKTELITNVSHDIKTPLTSIINYVDLLQKPHTDAEQEAYLEVLERQSQRLKKLIDDLMEMSKASTGNMTVEITTVDAVESVNQALGEFADKLSAAQLTPMFRHTEESVAMMADGKLVWRVMSNLLTNAVKYAMPGTRLYIDLMELEGKVVISLKNISREELNVDADELMERFVRGDDSRNTEGSGLGLNIAKSLMELQKGQLQLLVDGDLFKVTLIFPGA